LAADGADGQFWLHQKKKKIIIINKNYRKYRGPDVPLNKMKNKIILAQWNKEEKKTRKERKVITA
jgi:hypothetical protein